MKHSLAMILAAVMLLSLTACGTSSSDASATTAEPLPLLQAGYGKVDITPTEPVSMTADGDAEGNLHTGIKDYLYANCIYLVDNTGTELYLIAFDQCNMYDPLPAYRLELAQKLGVSDQQLMFSATHTHSAVALRATNVPSVLRYNDTLKKNLEKVALLAKEDAAPVTGMYHSSVETESLNFVRRYVMNDGTYAGDNYGSSASGYAAHESEGDQELQLLKLTRESSRDIILTNFQTHPHRTAYDTDDNQDISSDIVGVYRQEIEQRLDCLALYYTGSSGNVNPTSKITEENVYANHREHGKAMADYAVQAAASFTPVEIGPIQLAKTIFIGESYLSENYKLEEAKIVADRYNSGMSKSESLAGYEDLFEHPRHAMAIVSRAGWPETREVPLYSFSIGGFTACYAPFELFAELGVMIKDSSPFEATFVCCYSNYIFSYMPTSLAFEHGGYGPYKCNFEPGTGEQIVDAFLEQMNGMYATK